MGLALAMTLNIYTNVTKELGLKLREFRGLIPRFVKVTGKKLLGKLFAPYILNKVKNATVSPFQ